MSRSIRRRIPAVAPAVAILVAVLICAPAVTHATELGLRPVWTDHADSLSTLSMDERLALIDLLDAALARGDSISTADRFELIRLYRSSPLMKHRIRGLRLVPGLDDATRRRELVLTYRATFNPWDAVQALDDWIDARPDDPEPWLRRGLIRLEEGVDDRQRDALDAAIDAFEQVLERAPQNVDAWRGLAVARITQKDFGPLLAIADTLVVLDGDSPGPYLLRALAYESMEAEHRAMTAWDDAFARMDPTTRRRFDDPDRFRVHEAGSVFVDELVESVPPRSERGWWARLTEAQALFGRPGRAVSGWDTSCGQAWLLYGRPEAMRLVWGSDLASLLADPRFSPYREDVLAQFPDPGSAQHANADSWVWLVRVLDDFAFPIVFTRDTRFATWTVDPEVEERILDWQTRRGPMRLAHSVPTVTTTDDEVVIDVSFHGFRAADGQLRIEAWSATQSTTPDAVAAIRLIVTDDVGRELDRVRTPVDPAHDRRRLAREVADLDHAVDGWVHGFGVLLPAGEYLTVVDAVDGDGKVVASRDARLRLDPDVVARRSFDISEPMICDAYSAMGDYGDLPPEFVRYARAVVPNPARELDPRQDEVSVYYEVYGAQVDDTGRCRLDVEYAVYAAEAFDPVLRTARYVDGEIARPAIKLVFPDTRSGVAGGGLVVRGTRLDVSGLAPGRYVLSVLVSDAIARSEAERTVTFEVPAERDGS